MGFQELWDVMLVDRWNAVVRKDRVKWKCEAIELIYGNGMGALSLLKHFVELEDNLIKNVFLG